MKRKIVAGIDLSALKAGLLGQVRLGLGISGCTSNMLVSDTDGKEVGYKTEQFLNKGENTVALYKDDNKIKVTGFKVQEI